MKNKPTYFYALFFLLFVPILSWSQAKTVKSTFAADTAKANRLNDSSMAYLKRGQLFEAMKCAKQAQYLSKKIGYKTGLARSYNTEGSVLYRKGKYDESIACAGTGLMLGKILRDSVIQSNAYNCMGNAYAYMGNPTKAMEFYFKGLNIEERISVQNNLHWYYNNIGNLFNEQKNYRKSLEYAFKAIKVEERKKEKRAMAVTLSNIGNVYVSMEKQDSALIYFLRAYKMAGEAKDTFALALSTTNVAISYTELKQYKLAYTFASKAYHICKTKGFKDLLIYNLSTLGKINVGLKNYKLGEEYLLQSQELAKKLDSKLLIKDGFLSLSDLYKAQNDYLNAYTYYKLFSEAKDSILNGENSKLITEMNTKYTTETKEKEIELLKKNEDIQNLELAKRKNDLDRQRAVSIGVFVGFVLLMVVAILLYSRYRLKKKANDLLQHSYDLIEEKNMVIEKSNLMITDSITYAKRIQDAILPDPGDLATIFSTDFFVLYKPSQIVSGDFYWCSCQENKIIFVVADCTGHGVPGAFMSMIGNTLLNEIVNERKVTSTKKIAELLNEKIIDSLHQNEGSEKYDGMDISICSIDKVSKEINFTGANHSMYTFNGELHKIKGNPFSIGGAQQQDKKTFTSQQIAYEPGLKLYFLTDGYCDQSHEETKKRFSSKQFESVLKEIQYQHMVQQKEILEQAFEKWKGNSKQRDDVLVVGITCN